MYVSLNETCAAERKQCVVRYALAFLALVAASATGTAAQACEAQHFTPYGLQTPWNRQVAGIPSAPNSTTLRDQLWNTHSNTGTPGNFNLSFTSYTYPVYYAGCATGVYPVISRNPSWGNLHNKTMPWNPAWSASGGSDGQVIVLDPDTGKEWNLWQVSFASNRITISNGNLVQVGINSGTGADPASYFTKENGFRSSRGVGIQYYAMLVQPEEIEAGVIRHALSMPIKNAGKTFVAPGTKSDGPTSGGVPEGTRFAIDVTDDQIESWVSTKPAQMRNFGRILARALRDYGWFVTDTGGGAHFQFEDWKSAGAQWTALGLAKVTVGGKEYPRDLTDGLITQSRIRALVPSDEYAQSASN